MVPRIRTFSFRVRGVWKFLNKRSTVSLQVGEHRLPISGHGMFLTPPKRGQHSMAELRELMRTGHVLSQDGRIQLSKKLDTVWQAQVMSLYNQVRAIVSEAHGLDAFFIYGTLLGAVREGGVIGHDIDFDAAYVSSHTDGNEAARELQQVAYTLIDAGMDVECKKEALHIHDKDDPSVRIDLFHLFFNEHGVLEFPYGVAGTTTFTVADWQGTEEIDFLGGRGLLPLHAEVLAEYIYGAGWSKPDPGFDWLRDRNPRSLNGVLPVDWVEEVYWANFYAHTEYVSGSSFFELVNARSDTPATVVDIGCGDGRDSCWFAKSGRRVMGLDRSAIGIRHAAKKAASLGLADSVDFRACDVSDVADLRVALADAISLANGAPLLFYLRFFLHSVPEDVQRRC